MSCIFRYPSLTFSPRTPSLSCLKLEKNREKMFAQHKKQELRIKISVLYFLYKISCLAMGIWSETKPSNARQAFVGAVSSGI